MTSLADHNISVAEYMTYVAEHVTPLADQMMSVADHRISVADQMTSVSDGPFQLAHIQSGLRTARRAALHLTQRHPDLAATSVRVLGCLYLQLMISSSLSPSV